MNIYELVEALGGQINMGRATVRKGREHIVIGDMTSGALEMTDIGRKMASNIKPVAKPKAKAKPKASPKKKS